MARQASDITKDEITMGRPRKTPTWFNLGEFLDRRCRECGTTLFAACQTSGADYNSVMYSIYNFTYPYKDDIVKLSTVLNFKPEEMPEYDKFPTERRHKKKPQKEIKPVSKCRKCMWRTNGGFTGTTCKFCTDAENCANFTAGTTATPYQRVIAIDRRRKCLPILTESVFVFDEETVREWYRRIVARKYVECEADISSLAANMLWGRNLDVEGENPVTEDEFVEFMKTHGGMYRRKV